ncbi:B- and T-lymphocyte attenuator-like isoform X2 [Scleropages formosus]|uniref:B- and T-lymphocyte attenuator-like isoform X2 n=1 Tax=Scleropages formosus TaxID=113540 RepID=UPI0008784E8D|nr:B- and T-lymphocyte attenuator isoform X2 [Scleropages formosus]
MESRCHFGRNYKNAKTDVCTVRTPVRARNVFALEPLKIHCEIQFCEMKFNVSWCKIDDTNDCRNIDETPHIRTLLKTTPEDINVHLSYLHFTQTSRSDSGQYRCKISGSITSVSHSIHVNVTDAPSDRNISSAINTTNAPVNDLQPGLQAKLPYIYFLAGIITILIIVIGISVFIMRRCEGSQKREKAENSQNQLRLQSSTPENSCQATLGPESLMRPKSVCVHPAPHLDHASGVYDNVPTTTTSQLKSTKASVRAPLTRRETPNVTSAVILAESIYDNDGADEKGEESCLVYAALNHKAVREGHSPIHSSIFEEDLSEYAPIRVS